MSEGVRAVFETYAKFGGDSGGGGPTIGMTSRNFVKLAKETGIVDKKLTQTVLDLSFTKAARAQAGQMDTSWGGKRINFEQFCIAIGHCAEARGGVTPEALLEKIAQAGAGGPKVTNVTQAGGGAAKFYDDKSGWTKTAKAGGPTKVDGGAGDNWSKSLN
eukprot:CAMPEP_0119414028 /NCGR_PEP_ID=MMETSP1335-20130426/6397_1 /TAXON_ID=259385 /ORGANISM="Chrysoculter rhomboideus, Strain RCC1486" /LENGTH=159 /DNA_ID=CAMNT_0007438877 /DNA_START=41 /DNA_END=520 /DNA_ORIENTATION=+